MLFSRSFFLIIEYLFVRYLVFVFQSKFFFNYYCPVKLIMLSKPSAARIVYRQAPLLNIAIKH